MSYCNEIFPGVRYAELPVKLDYRPYPQVGRLTSMTAGVLRHHGNRRILPSATCGFLLTQTARTLSRPCTDTSKMRGTCDEINKTPKKVLGPTHVTNATSGILTTFPCSTHSSWSPQILLPWSEIAGKWDGPSPDRIALLVTFCGILELARRAVSSSSSRSLSEKYPQSSVDPSLVNSLKFLDRASAKSPNNTSM